MSHFTVGVLVPRFIAFEIEDYPAEPKLNDKAIDAYISAAMAPYYEGLTVAPYDRECWCVGRAAQKAMNEWDHGQLGDFGAVRNAYWALPEEQRSNEKWEEMIAPWKEAEAKYKAEHEADFKLPDPECSECNGTGLYKSQYNPKSEWDWYVVGGRWDGDMIGNEQSSDNGFNFGAQHRTIKNNIAPVADLIKRFEENPEDLYTFFAVVTPDGAWHERGNMGWWGIVTDEKDAGDWEGQVKSMYLAHKDFYIVSIDAHI